MSKQNKPKLIRCNYSGNKCIERNLKNKQMKVSNGGKDQVQKSPKRVSKSPVKKESSKAPKVD